MWVIKGLRKGIITTKYPDEKPTKDEVPEIGVPVHRHGDIKAAMGVCPTDAISEALDFYKCIFCQRCEDYGFEMTGNVEIAEVNRKLPFSGSVHIFLVDAGSCNACNRELDMLTNPYYDLHRLGFFFTPTPRHADIMFVIGKVTDRMVEPMLKAYEAMPEPKIVVAAGSCATSGGIFGNEGVDRYINVDAKISGCPPSPIGLLYGLLKTYRRR
ncbi:formate hydrogenlyase subunit 7 [archaeon]|nr:formate hydrogenlyase subunit 7 [archaeon]